MKKTLAIYTGPLIGGVMLALTSGLLLNQNVGFGHNALCVSGILWSMLLLWGSIKIHNVEA